LADEQAGAVWAPACLVVEVITETLPVHVIVYPNCVR